MGLLRSLSKSFKLRKICKVLGEPLWSRGFGVQSIVEGSRRRDAALEELLDLAESDPAVRLVMEQHAANRNTLKEAYRLLCVAGADQWVKGHYVAACTLVYGPTLDYVLRKLAPGAPQREDLQEAAHRLIQYFKGGKVDLS
ncbi:MAG: hypothetical protein JSV41_02775 [Gemmatimonadota bacterium]|nr:MAG: hypothetical protein JSV41_02775 [Gemmatimonadota bacterium]